MSEDNKLKINKSCIINPTHFENHPVAKLFSVHQIIVHYTAAPKQRAVNTCGYFKKLASSKSERIASAHFVVDLDGTVYQFLPLSYVAWHAGNDSVNRSSIGIEMCIVDNNKFTPETFKATQKLVAILMKKYHIGSVSNVKRHYDITRKICPKPFVDNPRYWSEFKHGITEILDSGDITTEVVSSLKKESIETDSETMNKLFESIYNESNMN